MFTITLKMKTAAEIQAIIDALPAVNTLDLSTNKASQALQRLNSLFGEGGRIYLQDLGIREIGYARLRAVVGQALYMEPWDGTSDIIDMSSYLLGILGEGHTAVADPIKGLNLFLRENASESNFGRIRLLETDEVRTSIERGQIGEMLAAGIMEIEEDQVADLLAANAAFLSAEPMTIVEVDETLVAATDGFVDMTAVIPAGAVILAIRTNNETVITFDTATEQAIGIVGTLDKYIEDADNTLNGKLGGLVTGFVALAAAETLRWGGTNGSGAAAGTIDGTLRILVTYLIAADLADA